jgi:uncharacterized protein (TIGR03382 family)
MVALLGATAAHATPLTDRARASHARGVEVLPAAAAPRLVRDHLKVAYHAVPAERAVAWAGFVAGAPGMTAASWDRATGVPSRIWGRGVLVTGSVADPAVAAAAAWRVLGANLALLAPGARLGDFALVANDLDGDLRTIGFVQRHAGLPVVGGQVSFRFKRDRLFVIGSEALPDVRVAWPAAKPAGALVDPVRAATAVDLGLDAAALATRADGGLEIVPLVGARGVLGYRVAQPLVVDAGAAGAWRVWADPATGAPLVRRSLTPSAAGAITFDVPARYPGAERRDLPAPRLAVTVDGAPLTTDAAGRVSWANAGPGALSVTPTGPDVAVVNSAGELARQSATLAPDATLRWSGAGDAAVDAQLSAFVHASLVRTYARRFAPELAFLDEQLPVRVNIADECNAFSDGTAINFFAASDRCENTARIADVVYHEFGHSVHSHAIIRGVGFFDGAFSEGLSDYLAATITDDSGMGRGFFRTDAPLRELDPPDSEWTWPRDIDEIHRTGQIFGGAMWDLRKALIAESSDRDAAVRLADRLFYAAVRRASSIPATLIEILAADDDDGDLANGTPHECAIRAAFGRHGLRTLAGEIDAAGLVPSATTAPQPVRLTLIGEDQRCGDTITDVRLEWRPRDGGQPGNAAATAADDVWTAPLTLPADGEALFFRFRVRFADGSDMVYPANRADPWYQLYHGDVVPLYCTDFERNPLADGWRVGGDAPEVWQWGIPGGAAGVGDPTRAFSGSRIVGTGLSFVDPAYRAKSRAWIETPVIDVGQYSDVHLQYRRWLNVEDGFYDQATIAVNQEQAWANLASQGNSSHTTHHEDRAWLFQDVPLSSRIYDGTVAVRWILDSDEGLELGGWNLDDVCIVANPRAICGDGQLTPTEQCDDGAANADAADRCRTSCRRAYCGDGIVDSLEGCDDGNEEDGDACSSVCEVVEPRAPELDGTCAAGGRGAGAGLALGVAAAALLVRRRRR